MLFDCIVILYVQKNGGINDVCFPEKKIYPKIRQIVVTCGWWWGATDETISRPDVIAWCNIWLVMSCVLGHLPQTVRMSIGCFVCHYVSRSIFGGFRFDVSSVLMCDWWLFSENRFRDVEQLDEIDVVIFKHDILSSRFFIKSFPIL